jgi:hypothetical protein
MAWSSGNSRSRVVARQHTHRSVLTSCTHITTCIGTSVAPSMYFCLPTAWLKFVDTRLQPKASVSCFYTFTCDHNRPSPRLVLQFSLQSNLTTIRSRPTWLHSLMSVHAQGSALPALGLRGFMRCARRRRMERISKSSTRPPHGTVHSLSACS